MQVPSVKYYKLPSSIQAVFAEKESVFSRPNSFEKRMLALVDEEVDSKEDIEVCHEKAQKFH